MRGGIADHFGFALVLEAVSVREFANNEMRPPTQARGRNLVAKARDMRALYAGTFSSTQNLPGKGFAASHDCHRTFS